MLNITQRALLFVKKCRIPRCLWHTAKISAVCREKPAYIFNPSKQRQIIPTNSRRLSFLRNTGITSSGAFTRIVCPPSYTVPPWTSVHSAPAGR